MKYKVYRFLVCIIIFVFASCEKVINIKLNETDKKYVIEGILTNRTGACKVYISQTKGFNEDNSFVGVSGAQVTITDENGHVTNLTSSSAGIYEAATLAGTPGKKYELKVIINGKVFTSSSTIPYQVFIDTAYVRENTFFDVKIKLVNVEYADPVQLGNCYRFVQYVNGIKERSIFVRTDDLSNGRFVNTQLFISNDDDEQDSGNNIKTGDTVRVEMLCIDPAVYKYWYSLDQAATGTTESASPANPVTNITGGALGYFSAHTYQRRTIVVP